jgi:hypothetical protein
MYGISKGPLLGIQNILLYRMCPFTDSMFLSQRNTALFTARFKTKYTNQRHKSWQKQKHVYHIVANR